MAEVWREQGFVFRINSDDHEPSHVHVYKAKTYSLFYLGDEDTRPALRKNINMKSNELRKAFQIVCEQQEIMLTEWRRIHGQR
jgi:hypothetical protein